MSSHQASDDELNRLLAGVLTDTSLGRRGRSVREPPTIVEASTASQEDETQSYQAKVNRLTFKASTTLSDADTGTSTHRRVDSLFVDLTSSGVESSEGGAMLSARSTGNSTIDSVVDVTPLEYEVYQFPLSLQELGVICSQRQRGGINACIRPNCKLNHQGPKIQFTPGCVVVMRSSGSVFIDPRVSEEQVTKELLSSWKRVPRTLEVWRELFGSVNNRASGEPPVSSERLVELRQFASFAKKQTESPSGKGPSAKKFSFGETSNMFSKLFASATKLGIQVLSEQPIVDDSFEMDKDPSTPTPLLRTGEWSYGEAFNRLEVKIDVGNSVVATLSEKLDEQTDVLNQELSILFSRILRTENEIGPKVPPQNSNLEAPSLWGSISTLAAALDEIQSEILAVKAEVVSSSVTLEHRVNESVEDQLREVIDSAAVMMSEQFETVKAEIESNTEAITTSKAAIAAVNQSILLLAKGAAKLKEEAAELREILEEVKLSRSGETGLTEDSTVVSDLSNLKVLVRTIGQRIDSVVDGRETKSIKFFGITFRGHSEAEAWVTEHLDSESYGLIVDVHLVLEHIYHQAFCDDGALKELNSLYKIKIDNLTQGLAMQSFDYAMPRFFAAPTNLMNKKPKIRRPESSHFDNIENYEDWDLPIMGFRAKLKDHLEEFQETHVRMIGEVLSPDEPAYRVATMSVQTSVSWIQSFVAYIVY